MTQCSEITPMLSAFADGELHPNQTQEVRRHLAQCRSCAAELSENAALGEQLRAAAVEPALDGFAAAVRQRIDSLTPPIRVRLRRYFETAREQISATVALTAAGLATAALAAVMLAPYASQLASRVPQVAPTATIEEAEASSTARLAELAGSDVFAQASRDSHLVIQGIEGRAPSAALFNEPEAETRVVWVPDQR